MSKQEIKEKIKQTIEADPLKNEIEKASLFGSYLHGDFKKDSDVDILIEFSPQARVGFFRLIEIQDKFSQAVGKPVDLLTPAALSKYFRDEVLAEAEIIYAR